MVGQSEKLHSVFTVCEIVKQFGSDYFSSQKWQHVVKESTVGTENMRMGMPVDVKRVIMYAE
jgi:hypothetical protein